MPKLQQRIRVSKSQHPNTKSGNNLLAIDCEGLAGNWSLAAVQEGFKIQRRLALPGGFGNECIEVNRKLLGQFPVETGAAEGWTPGQGVSFLFGTPPCS